MSILNNEVVSFLGSYTGYALTSEANKVLQQTALQSAADAYVANGGKLADIAANTDGRKEVKLALWQGVPEKVRTKAFDAAVIGDTVIYTGIKGAEVKKRALIQRIEGTYFKRFHDMVAKLEKPEVEATDRERTVQDLSKLHRRLTKDEITGFKSGEAAKLIEHIIAMAKILG